jgi:hypothetical protein
MLNSEQYSDYLKEIDSEVRGALKIIRIWDDAAFEYFGCRLTKKQVKRLVGKFLKNETAARMDVVELVYEAIRNTLLAEDDWDNAEKLHNAFHSSVCWNIEDRKTRVTALMQELVEVSQEILCEQ